MILAVDPLLVDGVDLTVALIVLLKAGLAFVFLLVSVMLVIWFERKLLSDMQNRIGPDVAGPWGILQTLADGIKLFFKEDLIPDRADRVVFKLAPYLSLVPAFLVFSIVPIGGDFSGDGTVTWFGETTYLQVADPPVGVLFFLALSSVAVYGVMLAGWSSGSKYPLLGSVRASAQMISYEAALGLAIARGVLERGQSFVEPAAPNEQVEFTLMGCQQIRRYFQRTVEMVEDSATARFTPATDQNDENADDDPRSGAAGFVDGGVWRLVVVRRSHGNGPS